MSFASIAGAATAAALRARGLREERAELAGGWSMRLWRQAGSAATGSTPAEPWLLLHGLGATAATYLPLLSGPLVDAEVLLPELSALGGTRGPAAALGVPDAVERLAELLDRQSPSRAGHPSHPRQPRQPVTVAGVSLGGWIAVRLALARPDLVARLLLIVPGGFRDQDWRRIEKMVRVGSFADSKALWQALFDRPPWYLRWGRPILFLAYRSAAVAAALATVRENDAFSAAELARIAVPTGLIWGERDLLFRAADGRRMAAAIPRSRFYLIENAGHGVQWERPSEFRDAVERFRRELPLPDRGD